MFQHAQAHCHTCQRPTLFVRNSYDTPHVAHLIFVCALGVGALVAAGPLTWFLLIAAGCWLLIWASHTFANFLSAGVPFRCQQCSSAMPSPGVLADLNDQQRLQAAMAKAAAKRAGSATVAVALMLAFSTAGSAQQPFRPINLNTARPTRFEAERSPGDSYNQPATYKSDWQIERERLLARRQASRDATKERRERLWASLPSPFYTDEDYAKSRYKVAHMLWQNGRVEASRRNLEQLISEYPKSDTAELAKVVLERF
jgi:hypothetical protein